MSGARNRGRTGTAAFSIGLALGSTISGGTALLLYTGQGFLRAAGLLVSSAVIALAAGLWAGTPDEATRRVPLRGRWVVLIIALLAAGLFAAVWSTRPDIRDIAPAGALAVLLALALPAYATGALLSGLHTAVQSCSAPTHGVGVAASATAGAAFGVLAATAFLIQTIEPYGLYYGAAALVSFASLLDRNRAMPLRTGECIMNDRVVIVTGFSEPDQLAWALAERFLAAGASIAVTSRRSELETLAARLGAPDRVLAVRADLLVEDEVAQLVESVRTRFGRIDVLVNTAGGLSVTGAIADTDAAAWTAEIERNAGTVLRTCRAALPLLRETRGSIINFASPAGEHAVRNLGAYSAAKAAVIALTQALALEEKVHGVRVNAIAPGMLDTGQNREAAGDHALIPLQHVADAALFLATTQADGVTGEVLHVRQ